MSSAGESSPNTPDEHDGVVFSEFTPALESGPDSRLPTPT